MKCEWSGKEVINATVTTTRISHNQFHWLMHLL